LWNALVKLLADFLTILYKLTVSVGIPNYGLAIILFTVIVRLLMFPLSLRQSRMTKSMQLIQPKMKQLQQQYKNSPEIMNREIAALYKKYNANPMSGCLPMLIQMPILFALFQALRNFQYEALGSTFLWIPNLSEPDKVILPILVAISSYVQSKITMAASPQSGPSAQSMNITMLYFMPLMIGWMSRNFAAGLAIYWVAFNTLGAGLQHLTNIIIDRSHKEMKLAMEEEERAEEEARAAKAAARPVVQKKAPKKTQNPVKQNKNSSADANRGKALDFDQNDE
jgi:YidC/Oxa1 family membrane protein insertase